VATASPAHPSPSPVPAPPSPVPAPPSPRTESSVPLRTLVPGTVRAGVKVVGGRTTVQVRSVSGHHRGALTRADGDTIAEAARVALDDRLPLVMVLSSSGSEVSEGIDALHGWGGAAAAVEVASSPRWWPSRRARWG